MPIDNALAQELIEMADAEERAVGAFFGWAIWNEETQEELQNRLGWRPGEDPVEMWEEADTAPPPVWMAEDWEDAPKPVAEVIHVVATSDDRFREIIETNGWPGRSLVGEDGADAAWFLAMHADHDPLLQRRCVTLLTDAVGKGEADPRHLAWLTDRVNSHEDGTQTYGTLAMVKDDEEVLLAPVRDEKALPDRRRALGLPPLHDDLRRAPGQIPYRHLRRSASFKWPRHDRTRWTATQEV